MYFQMKLFDFLQAFKQKPKKKQSAKTKTWLLKGRVDMTIVMI